jgi:hypothetical protein
MPERIAVYMSPNERGSDRARKLALAINDDPRFSLPDFREIDVDLQFSFNHGWGEHGAPKVVFQEPIDYFNVELKETSDYVSSALGKDGHLYQQVLSMREAGHPAMIVVLGGDSQVSDAIMSALKTRYHGKELGFQIGSYESRLRDFEGQCFALGMPIMRWQTGQYKRLLSVAHKVLCGASLMSYKPRPADNERQTVALCMAKHIGEKTASALITEYGSIANLCTASLEDLAAFKQNGRKIGMSKAESVVRLIHGELPGKHDIRIHAKA